MTITVMTDVQDERRARIIAAATALASEGGYDAVQMRTVAASAQVALGTLYRYFPSKDRLLSAAMAEWARQLRESLSARPPAGETMTERILDVLRAVCGSMEQNPTLTAALVSAVGSRDPGVREDVSAVSAHLFSLATDILRELDDRTRLDVFSVIAHVWYSATIRWNQGRHSYAFVYHELERAVRLILPPLESTAAYVRK